MSPSNSALAIEAFLLLLVMMLMISILAIVRLPRELATSESGQRELSSDADTDELTPGRAGIGREFGRPELFASPVRPDVPASGAARSAFPAPATAERIRQTWQAAAAGSTSSSADGRAVAAPGYRNRQGRYVGKHSRRRKPASDQRLDASLPPWKPATNPSQPGESITGAG